MQVHDVRIGAPFPRGTRICDAIQASASDRIFAK
jgi:hypothetical protein